MLNSLSANSLCKVGCPKREKIDIKNILAATGINQDFINPKVDSNVKEFTDTQSSFIPSAALPDQQNEDDPCHGLYGYYRISCLYDVTIKGFKDVNNACRFAQSFDELKFAGIEDDSKDDDTLVNKLNGSSCCPSSLKSSAFIIILVIVSFLFFSPNDCKF